MSPLVSKNTQKGGAAGLKINIIKKGECKVKRNVCIPVDCLKHPFVKLQNSLVQLQKN